MTEPIDLDARNALASDFLAMVESELAALRRDCERDVKLAAAIESGRSITDIAREFGVGVHVDEAERGEG